MRYSLADIEQETNIIDAILDSVQSGVVIVDRGAGIVRINSIAANLFGTSGSKALGMPLSAVIADTGLARVLETGQTVGPVSEHHKGRHLFAKHLPLFSEGEGLVGALGVYTDITEDEATKRQLMEALHKEKELEAILEHSHDGIWIMDGKGKTLRVSKSWEDFSGIKRKEVIGRTVHDIVAAGVYTDSAAIHVIQKREPVTIMYSTRTHKSALVTATPVFGRDGSIWRIISNVRDITELNQFKMELEKSLATSRRMKEEIRRLRRQCEKGPIIAHSRAMKEVLDTAVQIARSEATILISGETGVGKDVVARFIHGMSCDNDTLVRVNCGAIPETLIESELFGYEEGSFTGARSKGKPGLFELAQGGTLFLDEVGELPLAVQAKLLHVLQDHTIMRVGGVLPISLNVRVIAATNRDLRAMSTDGTFRQDLYYRLSVFPLHVPPLRERVDDILPLSLHFLEKYNNRYKTDKSISPRFLERLREYSWPGNVRELENTIERLVVTNPGNEIDIHSLNALIRGGEVPLPKDLCDFSGSSLRDAKEELERSMLAWALKHHGSTRKAAAALGVTQPTVVRLARKHGLGNAGAE